MGIQGTEVAKEAADIIIMASQPPVDGCSDSSHSCCFLHVLALQSDLPTPRLQRVTCLCQT